MVPDSEVQKALDYLRDNASIAAQAEANYNYLKDFTKTVKARLMSASGEKSAAAQEREAYANEEYVKHLKLVEEAEIEAHKHKFLLKAAAAKIDAWRTSKSYSKTMGKLQ